MSTAARKIKPAKGVIPAGFANGGKVVKDTRAEEMKEAKAVRSGKVTPKQYVQREQVEEKKEGEKKTPAKKLAATGKALATGKLSAQKYAAKESKPSMKKGA